jgi:uncharacterized membrane protein
MLKTSSKTSWLNVCHILITTVVKFLHENSRQFPLDDHQTTEINNFKNIFDALVIEPKSIHAFFYYFYEFSIKVLHMNHINSNFATINKSPTA